MARLMIVRVMDSIILEYACDDPERRSQRSNSDMVVVDISERKMSPLWKLMNFRSALLRSFAYDCCPSRMSVCW